jgi:hypothetical protein
VILPTIVVYRVSETLDFCLFPDDGVRKILRNIGLLIIS